MSEEIDLGNVGITVMWLVNSIKSESNKYSGAETPKIYCALNDYSEFEMYELRQQRDSEDRF